MQSGRISELKTHTKVIWTFTGRDVETPGLLRNIAHNRIQNFMPLLGPLVKAHFVFSVREKNVPFENAEPKLL